MTQKENVTVLVADDNPQNLLTVDAILGQEGYKVATVSSGKDALKYLLDHDVALVMLDVLMPGLNGFETASCIRKRDKTRLVPIIFTSGFQIDEVDIYTGYDLGAIDYLTLPLVPYILKSKVAALVSLYLKERELLAKMERIQQFERLQFENEKKLLLQEKERERLELEATHQKKEMEREQSIAVLLQEKAAALERANVELERFSTVVAHDLQEPLRTISCYLSLLDAEIKNVESAQAKEYIQFVQGAARRMSSLITDILNFSQIQNKSEQVFTVNEFEEVIKRAVENLDAAIKQNKAEIVYKDLPKIFGNRPQLIQVVQNLISNSIKFTSNRTPRIEITHKLDGDMWVFEFKDNGIGIEKKYFHKIFTAFERVHNKSVYPGTGVGLAICKKIIEKHGGKIWMESEENIGTSFFFTLPKNAPEQQVEVNGSRMLGMSVLLVDDDPSIGLLLERYFSRFGVNFDITMSGLNALSKIKEKKYDSIILDIQMPEMDGIETLNRIRKCGCLTPTAAFTGMDFSDSKHKFISAGFTDVVSKHNGLSELTKFLNSCQDKIGDETPADLGNTLKM